MKARRVLTPVLASFALAVSAVPAGASAGMGGQSGATASCVALFTSNEPQLNGEFISGLAQEGHLGSSVTVFSRSHPPCP
jgi:hypothetical protein